MRTPKEQESPGVCFVCGKPAWSGDKRDIRRVCFDCFKCSCPKCGHETFWVVTRKHPMGGWLCFSLTCPGWYEQPPFEVPAGVREFPPTEEGKRFCRLAERAGMLMDAGMDFEAATRQVLEQECS